MDSYQEFKMFYYSNIILFILILFVIIYIIINWDYVSNGNYWSGEIVKPILISGILFLILHMILTWDDDQVNNLSQNEIILPKYKLGQDINNTQKIGYPGQTSNPNPIPNEIINGSINIQNPSTIIPPNPQLNHKYQILNKFDTQPNFKINKNPTIEQFNKLGQNFSNTDNNNNKLSNQNIFISQKNSSKYGIKFI